ncbi:MAG: RodZ domain-containing protein [Acidobacteriota bacterium]
MPTLGETLKQKREERGISLAEISEATKIGTRFLKAIESDNFSILPGGIFTRSFIRAYARTVHLDEEEAIALYHQQIAPPSEEAAAETPASKPAPVVAMESPRRSGPLTFSQPSAHTRRGPIIIGVIITIFVAVLIYVVIKRIDKGQAEPPPSPPPVTRQTPPPAPQPETPPQTSTTPSVQPGDQLMVRVEAATGDCWLRYTVDSGEASQLILKQGEARDLPAAQNEVVLKYGNRQTIKVMVNSREIIFPADAPKFSGEIKLSRDNLQSFFN